MENYTFGTGVVSVVSVVSMVGCDVILITWVARPVTGPAQAQCDVEKSKQEFF